MITHLIKRWRRYLAALAAIVLLLVLAHTLVVWIVRTNATDADGMTRGDVAELSLEEEFALASGRYTRMQRLLEEAQLQISDDPWLWSSSGELPRGGALAITHLPGSDNENSYYLGTTRMIELEGSRGDLADLKPMIDWADSHGWQHRTRNISGDYDLLITVGNGWYISYSLQQEGTYAVEVLSDPFWTNSNHELLQAIGNRIHTELLDESIPGKILPFPKWSDPANADEIEHLKRYGHTDFLYPSTPPS